MGWLLKLATGNPINLLYLAGIIAIAAAGVGGTTAWTVQGWRLDAANARTDKVQASFDGFKAQVAAEGKVAQERANAQAAKDKLTKETADAENARVTAALRADITKLRRERDSARVSTVPAAPAGSGRPDLACFDRSGLESALRGLLGDIRGLVDQGAAATLDLNTAKAWAQTP